MSELKNNNSGGKEISEKKEKKDSGTPSKKEKKTKSKKFKIPSLFKKKYRVKKFEKKILKKLYVPGDRNFVAENFNYTELSEPEKKDKKTRVFFTGKALKTKSDENRLKQLSKEIKKQHGTVKLLPLGLFLLVCIGIFGFFLIFGNLIVEKVLVSSLEGIFGAKAEVSNVRLSLPSSLLKLDRITVANKDAPMYNLFEVEGVKLEFNLLELSRKKVDIEDFTISGIQWGTKRTVSGALPEKEQKKIEKKASTPPAFVVELTDKIKEEALASLNTLNESFNPKLKLEKTLAELESPGQIEKLELTGTEIAGRWSKTVSETEEEILTFAGEALELGNTDFSKLNFEDPEVSISELRKLLEKVAAVKKQGEILQQRALKIKSDFESDISTVQAEITNTQTVFNADKERILDACSIVNNYNLDSISSILSETASVMVGNLLGKWEPLVSKVSSFVIQNLKNKDSKPVKETKKNVIARSKGRTFSFGMNNKPSFLLENAFFSVGSDPEKDSGSNLYTMLSVKDISSDASLWGKPASALCFVYVNGMEFSGEGTADFSDSSAVPVLIKADCGKIPVDFSVPGMEFISGLKGNLNGNFNVSFDNTGKWTLDFRGTVSQAVLSSGDLGESFFIDLYKQVLAEITTVDLNVVVNGYQTEISSLSVKSDTDKQLVSGVKSVLNSELEKISASMREYGEEYIRSLEVKLEEPLSKINEYTGKIQELSSKLSDSEKLLEDLSEKIQDKIEEETKKAASGILDNIQVPEEVKKLEGLKNLKIPGL